MKNLFKKTRNKLVLVAWKLIRKARLPFRSGRLLIIRTDAIGDYILCRNFFESLKKNPVYEKYSFYLLGNKAFQTMAEKYDAAIFDHFIWVDPAIFFTVSPYDRIKLALGLKIKRFDIVINPVHSRIWEIDMFIAEIGAKKRIGSAGDNTNNPSNEKWNQSCKIYSELLSVPPTSVFEFERNDNFFEKLLNERNVKLIIPGSNLIDLENKDLIVIFPGAGSPKRQWSPSRFAEVINRLSQNLKQVKFIIAGGENDKETANEILQKCSQHITIKDYSGQTDLPELVEIIRSAKFLISNETSAIHISAAVGTPAICISNGNHFGRFNPYPKKITSNIKTLYPCDLFYDTSLFSVLSDKNRYYSSLDINKIEVSEVYDEVIKLLNKRSVNLKNN